MKIRRSILGFAVLLVVLTALVVWLGRKPAETTLPTVAETDASPFSTKRVVAEPQQKIEAVIHTNPSATSVALGAPTPTTPLKTKGQQMREGLAKLNNEEVVLYGRVIDQFDSPVAGAVVAGSIQVNNGTREGADKISIITDASGLFSISGYKGKALGINVSKAGYVLATTNTRFIYSLLWPEAERHVPDPNNPVVIKMWKLQGVEPLLSIDQHYKLYYTNGPICFDLITGKIVPTGGDIKIKVNRPPGEVSEHNPQKWSIDFEIVHGGFIETSDKEWGVTYAAPENGYQPNGTFGNNNGPDLINKALFIQSRNGQIYCKLGFSFRINNKPDDLMYVRFSGVANTNGSRNWEATAPQ